MSAPPPAVRPIAAALHAAANLNVSFAELKAQMSSGRQLQSAIRALKPEVDAAAEAQRAAQQAHSDLRPSQG